MKMNMMIIASIVFLNSAIAQAMEDNNNKETEKLIQSPSVKVKHNPLFDELAALNAEIAVIAPGVENNRQVGERLIEEKIQLCLTKMQQLVGQDKNLLFAQNMHGQFPIHVAASQLHLDIVRYLVSKLGRDHIANNFKDVAKNLPLDYVVMRLGLPQHLKPYYPEPLREALRKQVFDLLIAQNYSGYFNEGAYKDKLNSPLGCDFCLLQ